MCRNINKKSSNYDATFVSDESWYNTYRRANRALSIVGNIKSITGRQNNAYVTCVRNFGV